jgi:hypothetical protein
MKTYTLELCLAEGSDEFWESLVGRSGCDEILTWVRDILEEAGIDFSPSSGNTITLREYRAS